MTSFNPLQIYAFHKATMVVIEFDNVHRVWFGPDGAELYHAGPDNALRPFRVLGPDWTVKAVSIGRYNGS